MRLAAAIAALVAAASACSPSPSPPSPPPSPPSPPPTAWSLPATGADGGAVAAEPFDGAMYPAAIASGDGRLIVVAGSDANNAVRAPGDQAHGVVAASRDGGRTWRLARLASGPFIGAAVSGATVWLTAECPSRCLVASTDAGATWLAMDPAPTAASPALSSPTSGAVLTVLAGGLPTRMRSTADGGRTFTDTSPCPPGRSPVSISLDGDAGVAACRTDGDPVVDYNDDWLLAQRQGGAWTTLYRPAPAAGSYNPDASPSLSVSWVGQVVRRAGWATLTGGAGLWKSLDDGRSWSAVAWLGTGLPYGVLPSNMTITQDGIGLGLSVSISSWRVVATTTRASTWTEVAAFGE